MPNLIARKNQTEEEDTVLHSEDSTISSTKLEVILALIEREFNLTGKDFTIRGFADKGSKCIISVENNDFELEVCIKDTLKYF